MTQEMSTGQGFNDPPVKRVPRYDWAAIARKCKRRPGRWYQVFENDLTSLVVAINIGSIKPLDKSLGFETRTANNTKAKPRTCDLWIRYDPTLDTTKKKENADAAPDNG